LSYDLDMASPLIEPDRRIRVLAWSMLWLTVAVVVGGALVRATDSGAGCGETWPICGGQLIPNIGTHHTAIEVSHRLTTGLLGTVLVLLFLLVRRQFPKTHHLRRAVFGAGVLLIIESLLGASLVLFGWVEYDASIARLIVVPVHLINTFLLVASMALVAHFASGGSPFRVDLSSVRNKVAVSSLGIVLIIGATGALNALADTLILSGHLREPVPGELLVSEAVLRQVRTIHPFTAIIGGLALLMLVRYLTAGADRRVRFLGLAVQGVIWLQFILGLTNIALEVPLEIQLVHLFVADVLWILFVLIAFNLLGETPSEVEGAVSRVGTT
jgi:heme a synthase